MKPSTTTPIDPTVRTVKDRQMIKKHAKLLATHERWRHSKWAWLRKIATNAAHKGREIESYLTARTQAAMEKQNIAAFNSGGMPFTIVRRFLMVTTDDPSGLSDANALCELSEILAQTADDGGFKEGSAAVG